MEFGWQTDVELEAERAREGFGPVLAERHIAGDASGQFIEEISEGARVIAVRSV